MSRSTRTALLAATIAGFAFTAGCAPVEDAATSTSSSSTPKKSTAKSGELSDGGWTATAVKVKNDGLGDFGGTARVTNTEDDERTGVFTITVFKAGKQVASLQGSANNVGAGKTATVQLVGSDKYVSGPYTYEFQNDL